MKRLTIAFACAAILFAAIHTLWADKDTGPTITWQAKDASGSTVDVPAKGKVTVLVFIMPEQDRSQKELATVRQFAKDKSDVQVVAVISGKDAVANAKKLAASDKWPFPVVADTEYEASGRMHVRVWPTTLIVDSKGKLIGRVAGLPMSLAKQLDAYAARAAGRISDEQLKDRLEDNRVIGSSKQGAAERHLQVARRLIDALQFKQARQQVDEGLELSPTNADLLFLAARLDVLMGDPASAIKKLDSIKADALPQWQVAALRGRALVELKQWKQAEAALKAGLELNPHPAETWYFLGRVYEANEETSKATHAYRKAFETAPIAQRIAVDAKAKR